MTKLFNLKKYKNIRKALRNQPIKAEKLLWYKLRRKNLNYKFRRQASINNYVVDFYCPSLKFIIEIDGATHSTEKEIVYDTKRENYLKSLSLNILRFNNSDIYQNIDGVIKRIKLEIDKIKYN